MFISGDRMHSSLRSGNFILFSCKHTLPQKLFSESGEVTFSSNWYHRSISINVYINCIICNSLIQDFDRINWIELNYHTITDMPGVIPTGWGNNHGSKLIKVWYPNDIGLYFHAWHWMRSHTTPSLTGPGFIPVMGEASPGLLNLY